MPWDPIRDLLTMQERLESLFGRATPGWVPPADLLETAAQYQLTVEVPGLTRADIQIEFREGVLTVRGQRPNAPCPERFHQLERGQGQFHRSFHFTQAVDADAISADLADGLLTIVVPKAASTGSRQIDVADQP